MTDYGRILLAGAGSALLLAGALASQFIGGLAPCPLCIWQRWPHLAAAVVALFAVTVLWRLLRPLAVLGAGVMAVSAGLALFHVGVEQGWWSGPGTCSAASPVGADPSALLDQILDAPLVRCDEVAWAFLGLSMAAWNGIISMVLAGFWIWPLVQPYDPDR